MLLVPYYMQLGSSGLHKPDEARAMHSTICYPVYVSLLGMNRKSKFVRVQLPVRKNSMFSYAANGHYLLLRIMDECGLLLACRSAWHIDARSSVLQLNDH